VALATRYFTNVPSFPPARFAPSPSFVVLSFFPMSEAGGPLIAFLSPSLSRASYTYHTTHTQTHIHTPARPLSLNNQCTTADFHARGLWGIGSRWKTRCVFRCFCFLLLKITQLWGPGGWEMGGFVRVTTPRPSFRFMAKTVYEIGNYDAFSLVHDASWTPPAG
jgi:hypothetical protein